MTLTENTKETQRRLLTMSYLNHIVAISCSQTVSSSILLQYSEGSKNYTMLPTHDIVLNFIIVFPEPNCHVVGLRKKRLRKVMMNGGTFSLKYFSNYDIKPQKFIYSLSLSLLFVWN